MSRVIGVSAVGLQPSATAVALKTWHEQKEHLDDIWLFPTGGPRGTEAQAQRLENYFRRLVPAPTVKTFPSAPGLAPQNDLQPLGERLTAAMQAEVRPGETVRWVACGEPGMKALGWELARTLPNGVFLYTEHDELVAFQGDTECQLPMSDLGLAGLLELYGLQAQHGEEVCRNPARVVADFAFRPREAGIFQWAFERHGWLYLCAAIDAGDAAQRLRKMRDLVRVRGALNGLNARVTVVSDNASTLERAHADGWLARRSNELPRPCDWVTQALQHAAPRRVQAELGRSSDLEGKGGWAGPPLALWLGIDASPTLTALYTHCPEEAYVLYDALDGAVDAVRQRLQAVAAQLPVASLHLVVSDALGRGVAPVLQGVQDLHVNLTPGRQAQTRVLLQADYRVAWSLRPPSRQAVAYATRPHVQAPPPLGMGAAPLRVAGRVIGGPLRHPGKSASQVPKPQREFLLALGRFLAGYLRKPERRLPVQRQPWPNRIVSQGCSLERKGHKAWLLRTSGRHYRGTIDTGQGTWFEEVVAMALQAAGADEVRMGMKWARQGGNNAAFLDEIDVAARFRHRYVAVECKTGIAGFTLRPLKRGIEARARRLGRLTLPILVLPTVSGHHRKEALQQRQGAVILGLADVADPRRLRAHLDAIWHARSV